MPHCGRTIGDSEEYIRVQISQERHLPERPRRQLDVCGRCIPLGVTFEKLLGE
jgi:hypothetical protein